MDVEGDEAMNEKHRESARKMWSSMTEEEKIGRRLAISRAMRESRKKGINKYWRPPREFMSMYSEFRAQFGATEARRLVEDHMAVVSRRIQSSEREG